MLRIVFGKIDNVIYNTSSYFKNTYRPDWILNDTAREMIMDIDKSTVLSQGAIESPVLGIIPPTALSGGVKTLILIDHIGDKLFNASNCGDNCAKWLLKMGKEKDITINLRHVMDFGDEPFDIFVVNTNEHVRNMKELVLIAGRYV